MRRREPLKQIGPYRLVRRMAAGGFSDIFLAQRFNDAGYERTVVLKMLRSDLSDDQRFLDQVREESRILPLLRHENIVRTLEVGEHQEMPFLVMDFVFGQTVQQVLDRCHALETKIPETHVRTILSDVLAALQFAHFEARTEGKPLKVVHRDVSPSNVLIGFDGVTRLIDFGVAKSDIQLSRTRAGVVKGRFGYMSPEQVMRRELDGQSDVFGVGVMLWEMIVGRSLFERPNELETIRAVTREGVPFAKWEDGSVSWGLALTAWQGLQRSKRLRFGSAGRMRRSLLAQDGRSRDDAREDLQAWMQALFTVELGARDAALQRARGEPTEFRKLRDSGLELLPEVTDPGMPLSQFGRPVLSEVTGSKSSRRGLNAGVVAGVAGAILVSLGVGVLVGRASSADAEVGYVYVLSNEAAEIRIGGRQVGRTPVSRVAVLPGQHRISAFRDGRRLDRVVVVRRGQNRLVRFRFGTGHEQEKK